MKTTIDGFQCEMVPNDDREGFNCFISKGRASNSLAYVEDNGSLELETFSGLLGGGDIPVPQETIDKIAAWAMKNGY